MFVGCVLLVAGKTFFYFVKSIKLKNRALFICKQTRTRGKVFSMEDYNTGKVLSLPMQIAGAEGLDYIEESCNLIAKGELTPRQIIDILRNLQTSLETYISTQEQITRERSSEYISVKEAAKQLHKTPQTLYQKIQRGGLPEGTVIKSPAGRGFKILVSRLNMF